MPLSKMPRTPKGETVESLEQEMAELNSRGAALVAEIDRFETLADETEDANEVTAASAGARAARNRLKKLNATIDDVAARLALAKDTRRAKVRDGLIGEFEAASRHFLTTGRLAQAAFERAVAAREALQTGGFRREHAALPMPPAIGTTAVLARDVLDHFEAQLSRGSRNTAALSVPLAAAPEATRKPKVAAVAPGPGTRVVLGLWPPTGRPPRRAPRNDVAGEGETLVQLIRPGAELPDGAQGVAGDVISVPASRAMSLVRSGAFDFVAPRPPQSDESAPRLALEDAQ